MEAQRERGEARLRGEKINVESWGKQEGRDEQTLSGPGWDYLWSRFIHTLIEEPWSKFHTQTSVAEIREGKRDRGLGQTCADVCCSCKCSVFIKQIWGCFTAGTCSHVLIRKRQLCVTKHLSSSRGPMSRTAWATSVYGEPHRFHSSHGVDCMNIFKLGPTVAFLTFNWQH